MSFNTAITGLSAASTDLDVIGNNIANTSTVGFKTSRTEFGDLYATAVVGAGSANIAGSGVTVTDIAQDFQAGTIEFTNNNLDLAINGSGFFQLSNGQGGITYTRAGAFELDSNGFIVSKTGGFLQGFGLDAQGNQLPIANLAVTQRESPPRATQDIDLSFNIDSRADASLLLPDFNRNEPGSFTFSTTQRTFDSLGNEQTITFNYAEARPVQARQAITNVTTGSSVSGTTLSAADVTALNTLAVGTVVDSNTTTPAAVAAYFDRLTDSINGDPRIESITIDSTTPPAGAVGFTARFFSEFSEPDLVSVSGGVGVSEVAEVPANEIHTFDLDTSTAFTGDSLTQATVIEVGGISVSLPANLSRDQVGAAIIAVEANIRDANPNVESIVYNNANNELVVTYRAEVGNVNPGITFNGNIGTPAAAASLLPQNGPTTVKQGDNSFQGVYRMFAFLNGTQQLDIGKPLDPGEVGTGTEPGPIQIRFNPSSGLLDRINGQSFSPGANVPQITILGADPANSVTEIQLDLTGSTQFASASIIRGSDQDGFTSGDLIGVSFAETGEMVASFSNGQSTNLGVVAIATFPNQSGLQPTGNTEWIATIDSGGAIVNPPGTGLNGTLSSAALEQSNVDLSAELVALIEAQRNFQANSKTIETQNTVTQNILQI